MNRNHWIVLGFFLLPLAAPAAGAPAPASEVQLVVEHDHITAGDLAKVLPGWNQIDPAAQVAYAPLPGINRRVRRTNLVQWARRFGAEVDAGELPAALLIRRRMQRLSAARAEQELRGALARLYEIDPAAVHIAFEQFREPMIPATSLEFDLSGKPAVFNRLATISLRWRDPDGRTGTLPLRATLRISAPWAAARQPLAAGTELNATDFEFHEGPLPGAPEKFSLRPGDVEGKQLKYSLQAGDVLQSWMLVKRETVQRGDLIQLQLRAAGMLLQTPGRAEQDGSVGDRITCRNLDSGRRVTATVLEPKLAEVVFEP